MNNSGKTPYSEQTSEQRKELLEQLRGQYRAECARGLKLNMSRGIPGADQLDLSLGMLTVLGSDSELESDGVDCRSYGQLTGLDEVKQLYSEMLGIPKENMIIGGNSSLNMMYDETVRLMLYGVPGYTPWSKLGKIRFLCPSPGYDRHFAISEQFGMELVKIDMTPYGPDMDQVEEAVKDPAVKGMWCVPKYSNPEGITYSDETVRRLAAMQTAAGDFRVFWDNAYAIHGLYGDDDDQLLNVFEEAKKQGTEDRFLIFASTSKITFPGSGISVIAASDGNIQEITRRLSFQTIGYDKLNMLRHVRFFGSYAGMREHMKKHGDVLRPKFEAVLAIFDRDLGGLGIADWTKPKGGYFISLNVTDGCAKRVYELAAEAGVKLTEAGATFPYKLDPRDRNLRIAPSYPPKEKLIEAANILCLCVRIAALEKLEKGNQ